jgi:hypothetical protein
MNVLIARENFFGTGPGEQDSYVFTEGGHAIKAKVFVNTQKRLGPAPRFVALGFTLRTRSVSAKISAIAVGSLLQQKYVNLMVRNSRPAFFRGFYLMPIHRPPPG